ALLKLRVRPNREPRSFFHPHQKGVVGASHGLDRRHQFIKIRSRALNFVRQMQLAAAVNSIICPVSREREHQAALDILSGTPEMNDTVLIGSPQLHGTVTKVMSRQQVE